MESTVENTDYTTILTLVYGTSSVLELIISVAFLIFVLLVVNARRPDAGPWFIIMAIALILSPIFHATVNALTPIIGDGSIDSLLRSQVLSAGVGVIFRIAWWTTLFVGLFKLTQKNPDGP